MSPTFLQRSLVCACACLALASTSVWAAAAVDDETPWQEDAAPAAPAFSTGSLVPIDMGANAALRYGIDPATVSIGKDQVVRFVTVATSSTGTQNVWYQGINCDKGEFKIYARWSLASSAGPAHWYNVDSPEWRSLFEGNAMARPALSLAQGGMCDGRSPNQPIRKMLNDLYRGPHNDITR